MSLTNEFPYPKAEYIDLLTGYYAGINGPESFQPVKDYQSDIMAGHVYCSRGTVLEKAAFSDLYIQGGTIDSTPASLSFIETLAYPSNPKLPGFILMTNMNEKKGFGRTIVLYTDLIDQNGKLPAADKQIFSETMKSICDKYGYSFEELNAFGQGQGLLGGIGAECGFVNFFEEKDIPFIDEMIRAVLPAYQEILTSRMAEVPGDEDFEQLYLSRARLVDWIISEDYGVEIGRENGVPMEFVEAYAFPPVIKY